MQPLGKQRKNPSIVDVVDWEAPHQSFFLLLTVQSAPLPSEERLLEEVTDNKVPTMTSPRVFLIAMVAMGFLLCVIDCDPDPCSRPCENDDLPLCGRREDGTIRQFENKCEFEDYDCRHPKEFSITKMGFCH